jgi:hypothetical protein
MQWKGWINRGEPFHKAVTVGRYQLVLHIICGEKVLQSGRYLVVESFEFWFETLGSEFLMDVIILFDPF